MDTMQAFAKSQAAGFESYKTFDWDKAARLILEHKPQEAVAGLASDMEWTSGLVYRDGKIVDESDTYVYLSSNWATPVLVLDGEEFDCFKSVKEPGFTYWTESALKILEAGRISDAAPTVIE